MNYGLMATFNINLSNQTLLSSSSISIIQNTLWPDTPNLTKDAHNLGFRVMHKRHGDQVLQLSLECMIGVVSDVGVGWCLHDLPHFSHLALTRHFVVLSAIKALLCSFDL
jgi:hypothetical protein